MRLRSVPPESEIVLSHLDPVGKIIGFPQGEPGPRGEPGDTTLIHAATSKAPPVDADELPLLDSAASFGTKKLTIANLKAWVKAWIAKADVGLGNVDNTADTAKPISTATQTALDLKAPLSGPTFTGTVSGISKSMVGLGSVDNTADIDKPVSTAQQTALDSKQPIDPDLTALAALTDPAGKLSGIAAGATANSSDATLLARANHTGTQTADTITDGTTNKAYTATEKTKLSGVATAATANSSDATLLARANHTGTQSADTLTDGTTNKAFLATERTKLAGVEAGADVTDAANVASAGAVMESDTTTADMAFWDAGVFTSTGGVVPIERFNPDSVGFDVALSDAIDEAATDGGTVVLEARKTYTIDTAVTKSDVAVRIDFNGAKVVRENSGDFTALNLMYTHSAPQDVVGITSTTFTPSTSTLQVETTVDRIQVASTSGWAAGQWAVLVSDDQIVGANPTRAAQFEGERFQVAAVVGNYIYASRPLRATFTTNPRIARMNASPCVLIDPWFEDEAGSPASRNDPAVLITGAVQPSLRNVKMHNLQSMGLKLHGCVNGNIVGADTHNLRTSSVNAAYGYGVWLYSCCDFTLTGLSGDFLRHVFTTGAWEGLAADSPDLYKFGSNFGHRVSDSTARSVGHSAYDLHEEAAYCTFDNCHVAWNHREPEGTLGAYQLRGRHNTLSNSSSIGPGGVLARGCAGGGDFRISDYTHTLIPTAEPISSFAVKMDVLDGSAGRMKGHLDNIEIVVPDFSGPAPIQFTKQSITAGRIRVSAVNGSGSTKGLIYVEDSDVYIDTLEVDLRGSANQVYMVWTQDACTVTINRLVVISDATSWGYFANLNSQNSTVRIGEIETAYVPTSPFFSNVGGSGSATYGEMRVAGQWLSRQIGSRSDADTTITVLNGGMQILNVPLTANRTLTEGTSTSRAPGATITYVRTAAATGAYSWIIGSDALPDPGMYLTRLWSGSSWTTVGRGFLGITASPTELNILDGATVSTTELNYLDGTTSAIQDQLDGKMSATPESHAPALGLYFPEAEGAVGDGSTDDTAAFTATVAAMPSSGGVLSLQPDAVYEINSTWTVAKPVRIAGNGATLKLGTLAKMVEFSGTSNIMIENLTFDGNRTALGVGGSPLLRLLNTSNIVVRNCRFLDSPSTALYITNCSDLWVDGNYFNDIYAGAIYLSNPGTGNHNEHIWIINNRMDTVQVSNTAGQAGIQSAGSENANRYIHVEDNTIVNSTKVGIGLDSLDHSWVCRNTVLSFDSGVGGAAGEAIAVTGSNNTIAENDCYGDGIAGAAAILLWAIAGRSNDNNKIINNTCTNGAQGIAVCWGQQNAAINGLEVAGNACFDNNRGIQTLIGSGVTACVQTGIVIRDNNVYDNTTEPMNIAQTGVGGMTGETPMSTNNFGHSRQDMYASGSSVQIRALGPATDIDIDLDTQGAGVVTANGVEIPTRQSMFTRESTVTAAGTKTLTIASSQIQVFTGSTTHTVLLPTTSVIAGQTYMIINSSSGTVTVQSSAGNTVIAVTASKRAEVAARVDTPTAAADWDIVGLGVTTGRTTNTVPMRDANANLTANTFISTKTATATAAGTTTLTIGSAQVQEFTGSTTQTVLLPTTSVAAGQPYTIINNSSGTVTVQSSGANTVVALGASRVGVFVAAVDTPTTAAHWIPLSPNTSVVASTLAQRDSSGVLAAAGFVAAATSTATAAGTTTLTSGSTEVRVFTGSTTQTCVLPTTSITLGRQYTIINNSSGAVTVNSSGGNLVVTLAAGESRIVYALADTPTTAAHWRAI